MVWLTSTSSMLLFLLLLLSCSAVAEEDNGDGIPDEKDDTNGACAYMDPRTDPNLGPCGFQGCPSLCGNPPTCSVAKTAVNEYDCLNGPSPECCQWNDNELVSSHVSTCIVGLLIHCNPALLQPCTILFSSAVIL